MSRAAPRPDRWMRLPQLWWRTREARRSGDIGGLIRSVTTGGGRAVGLRVRGNRVLILLDPALAGDLLVEHAPVTVKGPGVRLTRQRQILLELIDKTGEHLDAESLFQMAKEKDPKINRVTVYRTLKMLKAGGLVDELDLMHYGGDQHYYETRLKQEHAHVICLRCGKVEEFFGEPLQRLRKQVESHFGFQVLLARTEVGGYCAHCQTLRAREVEEVRLLTLEADKPAARVPKKRVRKN